VKPPRCRCVSPPLQNLGANRLGGVISLAAPTGGSPPGRSDRILNKCPRRVSTGLRTYSWQLGSKFANFHRPGATPECPRGINKGMRYTRDLTDEQWTILDPLIPKPTRREDGRGRPWKSRRSVLNGVLWVLRTGAPWAELPDRYPSFQTCHRRFQQWVRSGVVTRIMTALAHELRTRGAIDVREAFIDASFAPARKGVARSVKRNAARVLSFCR
jgi:transposase